MRAQEFIIRETEAARPTYKPTMDTASTFNIKIRDTGPQEGQIAPEILALKGVDKMYDLGRVTGQFVKDLMRKYPQTFPGADKEPKPGAKPGTAQAGDLDIYMREISYNRQNILKDLTSNNESAHFDNRFFYPARPFDDDALQGFRGDERTGRVENTAKKFDPKDMTFYLRAYKWAVDNQVVQPVPAEQWAMIALVEGRDDFGFNAGKWQEEVRKNPASANMDEKVKSMGLINTEQRYFVCLLAAKQRLQKGGMPFYQAWNGGTQNLGRYQAQQLAIKDPRNAPLLAFIHSVIG